MQRSFKATFEFETFRANVQAFLRTTMYWDAALMDDGSFERGDWIAKVKTMPVGNLMFSMHL